MSLLLQSPDSPASRWFLLQGHLAFQDICSHFISGSLWQAVLDTECYRTHSHLFILNSLKEKFLWSSKLTVTTSQNKSGVYGFVLSVNADEKLRITQSRQLKRNPVQPRLPDSYCCFISSIQSFYTLNCWHDSWICRVSDKWCFSIYVDAQKASLYVLHHTGAVAGSGFWG